MAQSSTRDVLLRFADRAELLPYESEDARPFACGHFGALGRGALIGGLYLMVADSVASQVLPGPAQAWLAFAAFDHLTATPPAASNPEVAAVLRRRMAVLELLVRLTMTHGHDWQTQLTHERRHALQAPERFRWSSMLRELVGSTWAEPTTQLALMTLRWGHPRFLLEWQHDPIPDDYPTMLEQLLSGVVEDNTPVWAMDAELAALLFASEPDANASVRARKRHRVVELGLAFSHGRVSTSLLFGIVEVLERFGRAQHERRAAAIDMRADVSIEFRVTTLRFEHMSSVAGSALEHLGDLVRNSKYLFIEEIKLPRLVREEDRCIQRCLADLTTPAASASSPHGAAPPRCRRPATLRRLACQNDSKSFAVFGSVMRYDTVIRELDVYYVPRNMDALAAWLAFGVFHVDAASQASSLCIRMPGSQHFEELTPPHSIGTPQWVEIFKRVLALPASASDLAPIDAKTRKSGKRKRGGEADATSETPLDEVPLPEDACVFVEVKKNTKARAQPLLRSPIVAVLGDNPEEEQKDEGEDEDEKEEEGRLRATRAVAQYQVVRRLREWLAIAVPGAGAAWIPSSAVTSEHVSATRIVASSPAGANARIKSFSYVGGSLPEDFELRRQHSDALVALLSVIGEPLQVLQLPCNGLQNAHIAPILAACPNLTELNLAHNDITDIAPLVEAYAAGRCKITTLNVCQDGEDHARLVQQTSRILELGTEQPDVVTPVERLALRVTPFDEERIDYYLTDVIPPMQRAMFKSTKLEFARIHCDDLDQANLANEITRLRHQEYMTTVTAAAAAVAAAEATQPTTTSTTTTTPTNSTNPTVLSMATARVIMATAPTVDDSLVNRPLPMRAKLALLSVVHHESMQASALGALDTGVVGLVMQFARTTQVRVVSIAADPPVF